MIDFIAYGVLHKYPHMAPLDTEIWRRYIVANPTAFDAVAYDVAVGAGALFDTVVHRETGADVGRIYQRRIDVVARKGGQYFVIEVKPRAATSSLGQVKGYARLAVRDFPEIGSPIMMVVTDQMLPEMEYLAKEEGVIVVVV